MKLSDLGERKAIELIRDFLGEDGRDFAGRQDDCAVLEFGDEYLLMTTDMISAHTHIPKQATPWQAGWHAAAVNLSDIAAMGGEPLCLVFSLGLPGDYEADMLSELISGMKACAGEYSTPIVGGDTKEAETLTISGCALGRAAESEVLLRTGAEPGDVVAVTGDLGKAAAAYHALKSGMDEQAAVKNLLEIQPRLKEGRALARTGCVTSCMDISDGLASSIYQMGRVNGTGYELDLNTIPVSSEAAGMAKIMEMDVENLALYFGGDYELLFTVQDKGWEETRKVLSAIGTRITPIGRVVENEKNTLIKDGVPNTLENKGFEHFRWQR
ncbi:MAG: thiamine-phosphate kinase [Thermoplasmata archaeon]|nr:MAG: thiamine-phosphate kinase [Thermoplasmata archaeon]